MISRDELYRLVWSEPMSKLAERFGVSGSYLARVCTHLNVPRPERGYWAKLAVGKAPMQPPLPSPQPGDPLHWSKEGEQLPPPAKPKAPAPRQPEKKIRIARHQHGLVRGARVHFEKTRPIDAGSYLKPYKKLLVDVTASEAGLGKALDLASDLFNALESVGHRVVIAPADAHFRREHIEEREAPKTTREYWQYGLWSPQRPTVAYIGTVAVGLAIIEMSEHVTVRYVDGAYVRDSDPLARRSRYGASRDWTTTRDLPSGRMRIVAFAPYRAVSWSRQWDETKATSLRGQIRAIVEAIEQAGVELVAKIEEAEREAEIRRREWEAEHERWKRQEDRRRIDESIAASTSELRQVIDRWSAVRSIESFLAGVEQSADQLAEAGKREVLERLALARAFLGSQDPLDFFREWKTPEERYRPKYGAEQGHDEE